MNRLVPTFYRLHVSRSSAAAAAVMTNKLSLRSNQNSPVFHRFIRFAHQNAANRGTRKSNSNKKKKFWVPPESSSGGSSNPVRGCPELSRTVLLECPSTAKTGSCKVEVEAVIRFLKPEVVFLELCSDRTKVLTQKDLTTCRMPTFGKMLQFWWKSNTFSMLFGWLTLKMGSLLKVIPGYEFRVASDEAKACGAKVILGDRPVQVTRQRIWRKMPLWHKAILVFACSLPVAFVPIQEMLAQEIKETADDDVDPDKTRELSKKFPTLMETMVHERDQYMASMLHKTARKHSLVAAVVGSAHLPGIKKHWQQPVSIEEIMKIPERKAVVLLSALKRMIPVGLVGAGVAFVSCILLSPKK